jgi:site-specific recombinase XerD
MYHPILNYLKRLPEAMRDYAAQDGVILKKCIHTPHSLRATTATLLLDAGVDICKVQKLLGHRHSTTTRIDDKRRRSHHESVLHDIPV